MLGFVARALVWGVLLFALLRTPWVEQSLLVPFAGLQEKIGCAIVRAPLGAVTVDRSCTGSDALALCVGAIFAFPASWRRRLAGAALGLLVILAVNTLRIGTLAKTVSSPSLFEPLHLYVWPALLLLAAAGWVAWWMRSAIAPGTGIEPRRDASGGPRFALPRFLGLTALFVTLFYLAYPYLLRAPALQGVARGVARTAAAVMSLVGAEVTLSGSVFVTAGGSWVVTPECVATPLVAVYLAAIASLGLPRARRAWALAAAVPLFLLLGVLRLLVLALPPALVGSPGVAVHAFYQLAAGLLLVGVAAWRGHGESGWGRVVSSALAAAGAGLLVALLAGALDLRLVRPALAPLLSWLHLGHGHVDGQGALAILPAFQLGLLAALWLAAGRRPGRRELARVGTILALSQVLILSLAGELAAHTELGVPIFLVRAWALAVPFALWWGGARAAAGASEARYRSFWDEVGDRFPELGGAASTAYYRESEQWLMESFLAPLEDLRLFKTDLWDEARNTRILQWAAERGARGTGVDISAPTVARATRPGNGRREAAIRGAVGDVRALPFADGSFDAVYSMGTIEHFDETEQAVDEIFRVVRPGGRAIIGVPNRWDPFLRPLMVNVLYPLGLYGYGYEKSYSRRALRRLCEGAGFEVVAETGILFIPGWLRMLDLACWVWLRPLARVTALAVAPFAWLYRKFPGLRRHGYLIAAVGERPDSSSSSRHSAEPATQQSSANRPASERALSAFDSR